jgi:hypothetical protein
MKYPSMSLFCLADKRENPTRSKCVSPFSRLETKIASEESLGGHKAFFHLLCCLLLLSLIGQMRAQAQTDSAPASASPPATSEVNSSAPALEDPIGPIMWAGSTFIPRNLGPLKLDEKRFAKITQYPRGLAFQTNGDLLATLGNGTTPLMEITKWTGTTPSTLVHFQWHDYTPTDFRNAETMKGLAEGESHGVFWFFAGPLAVDGKNQIYFNLGACGPNGLYQLLQIDPINVQMLFPSEGFQSLQFFPSGSENLYTTSFSKINKMEPSAPTPSDTSAPFFSMLGGHAQLLHTLIIDEDHVLATLILRRAMTGGGAQMNRPPPELLAVAFDRVLKGYYVLDIKDWGPMAIRPTDQALFRFDADAKELRQFTLPFLGSANSAPTVTVSQPVDSAPNSVESNLSAGAILRQARDTYGALKSYSDTGTITTQMGSFGQSSTFSIRLQRPSFYRIVWEGGAGRGGATWSDGTGDFLRYPGAVNEKVKDRQTALAGATGISGGAAANVPGAFFSDAWGGSALSGAGDVQLKPDETVEQVACHVVVSTIHPRGATLTITSWIGLQDHLIHKIQTVTSGMPPAPKLDDSELKSILQTKNKPATPEAIAALRDQMSAGEEIAEKLQKSGMISTQIHENIETDKTFTVDDFKPGR